MSTTIGNCKSCAAFVAAPELPKGGGYCRRHPPTPIATMSRVQPSPANPQGIEQGIVGQYPPVHESGGCCDYLPGKLVQN